MASVVIDPEPRDVFAPPPGTVNGRATLTTVLLALIGLILCGRLVHLQGIARNEFAQVAVRQRTWRETVSARPGNILDRQGRVFATTIAVRSLYVVPEQIGDRWQFAQQVAPALKLSADNVFERIASHPKAKFLWIKRRISDADVEAVRALKLPEEAWGFRDEFLRSYPQGSLAAHVIGLRDIDGAGRGGIEQTMDEMLRGTDGWRECTRDARGRIIDVAAGQAVPPAHGKDVTLALDAVIQLYAERALETVVKQHRPRSCCAIVMDPRNGEILAMASRPTYDPNQPDHVPDSAWKNRPIADIYEPGSTFKPCIVAWALEQGLISQNDSFDCEHGEYRMGRRLLHDHHSYGVLSVEDILVKSSNIGMAKIGERLTNEGLHTAAGAFGFGRRTGIELPGELSGIVRPLPLWNGYSTGSVPMGQEIAATPLQIMTALAAIAGGGRLRTPHVVLRVGEGDGPQPPVLATTVVRPEIARWLTEHPMTEVVRRGTGRKAQISGYEVFGKTGTAQKLDPATGKYSTRLHVSSFVCGAPADNPTVMVLVSVDEPAHAADQYGGTVAAPAAAEILERTLQQLRIPPRDGRMRSALR